MVFLYYALKTIWIIAVFFIVRNYLKTKNKEIETNKELAKQVKELKRIIDEL